MGIKTKIFYRRLFILCNSIIGYCIKIKIDLLGIGKINKMHLSDSHPQVIVSLTSYGRRTLKVVFYTLVSLLKQNVMPNRIILWLDYDNWNETNLPSRLKKMRKLGVEISFCEDIKSYKKLIPTLQKYPNDIIITVDDDIYYSSNLIKSLYNGYLRESNKIHCTVALSPLFDVQGAILPYNDWNEGENKSSEYVFPVGVGGVLYPPYTLCSQVLNKELFMSLSPFADDIWFWIMALMQGTLHNEVRLHGKNYSFDALYQYFHKGAALTHSNSKENKNDVQLKAVLKYFNYSFVK